jgi:hypothetical protein
MISVQHGIFQVSCLTFKGQKKKKLAPGCQFFVLLIAALRLVETSNFYVDGLLTQSRCKKSIDGVDRSVCSLDTACPDIPALIQNNRVI